MLRVLAPFALGIALEDWLLCDPLALGCAAALGAAVWALVSRQIGELWVASALGALALALRLYAPVPILAPDVALLEIAGSPERSGDGCRVQVVVEQQAPGLALLSLPEQLCDLAPGDRALARMTLAPLRPATNPGGRDSRRLWARRGVHARARLSEQRLAVIEPRARGLWARVARLREHMGTALDPPEAPSRAGALLRTLVLGMAGALGPEVRAPFVASGTAHLLAVSGLHVGFVFALVRVAVVFALRRSQRLAVLRRANRIGVLVGIVCAACYAGLTGPGTPALRAAAMGAAGTAAVLSGRPVASTNALLGAGLVVLALDPSALWSAGLALSFSAVAGILLWSPPVSRMAFLHVTLAATLATAPFVAALEAPLPAGAILANAVAIPWFGAIVLPLGLLAAALGAALPPVAEVLRPLAQGAGELGIRSVDLLGSPDLLAGSAVPVRTATLLCAGGFALRCAVLGRSAVAVTLLVGGACTAVWLSPGSPPAANFVQALDVGHGDALVVRTATQTWLVDVGGARGRFDAGRHVVLPALRALGISRLDVLAITHADRDHLGGAQAVLQRLQVGELWLSRETWAAAAARPMRRAAAARGVPLRIVAAGQQAGGIEVLWPQAGVTHSTSNGGSIVLRADLEGGCALLAGDVPARVERQLAIQSQSCALLKLAHHGSRTSTDPLLLSRLQPWLAVSSNGRRPHSPLPHRLVRARLAAASVSLYETERTGALLVLFAPDGVVAMPFLAHDWKLD
jgi:competence protein ComEC